MSSDTAATDPVAIDFLARFLADRENGDEKPLGFYLGLFPGHEEAVAREYIGAAPAPEATTEGNVGTYRLLRVLGRGGQGTVWLAEDTRLDRRVALKVLRILDSGCGAALARLRREAELASRLDHPGICTVYEAGVCGSSAFIAMRLIEGETLATRIRAARELAGADPARAAREPIAAQVRIGVQIARALHAAHQIGVIHRDVKPGNVMITPAGEPVVLDFGVARDVREDAALPALTRSGDTLGTPAYMSPEQISGGAVDRRTDVWSLGVVLYEALTLRRPFEAPTHAALAKAVVERDPPDPRRLDPAVSGDLAAVLLCALAKEPGHRYQTAADLAEDLERVVAGRPVAIKPVSALARLLRWSRRRPAAAALVVLLALGVPAVTGLLGFLVASWSDLQKGGEQHRRDRLEAHLEQGFLELEGGTKEAALAAFAAARAEDPDSAEALAGVALVHVQHQDRAAALEELSANAGLVQRHAALQRVLTHVLRHARDAEGAGRNAEADELEKRLGPPREPLEFFVLGFRELVAADAGRKPWDEDGNEGHRRALELFTLAADHARTARPLYWHHRAVTAGRCKDEQAARASASVLELLWPRSALARWHAGLALSRIDPEEAVRHFQVAIELRPDDAWFHGTLGDALYRQGRAEDAIAAYRESLRLAPARSASATNLATLLFELGRTDEAAAELERAAALAPDDVTVAYNLGNARERQGRAEEALALYRKVIGLEPGLARAWSNVGAILARLGEDADALVHLRKAVELDPRHTLAWLNLGTCLRGAGELDEAVAAFEKTVVLQPSLRPAWELVAVSLADRGDLEGAVAAWAKVIELARPGETGPRTAAACAALLATRTGERPAAGSRGRPVEASTSRSAPGAASDGGAGLRALALGWLSSELELCRAALRSSTADKAQARESLRRWRGDPSLQALVHGLDSLPPDEQQAWRALWEAVTALLRETR